MEMKYKWEKEKYKGGRNLGKIEYMVEDIYEKWEKMKREGVKINRKKREGNMELIK